ncbi:polyadenylate-binding protein-interacting protein 3 isoform X1 [Arachis hypogaea]|uniref:polyadenylate-binding protein-interacting protein 3 isoform X1 n=1 Tax=Arachis hypogaea TaxID=3818 RepID=UPI000DEC731F|nr:polyadenylate-binding protein-interacting protein 3 isoform X2 [Arachis hypogaea]
MNLQQVGQSKSSNGYGRRKYEKGATKSDSKISSGKSNTSSVAEVTGSKSGTYESPSHDRLVYVTSSLLGHHVEVQVKNGSIYSGIFHATNTEKDFGIILKVARLIKDSSLQGQRSSVEIVSKATSKTLIIPSKELVQVIAKDVAVTRDGQPSESHYAMHQDIMVDSVISQSRHVEMGRELQRWVPDDDDPQCPELENIFDGPWNRGWDQFETNKTLFGVNSTFNEDLYTTKLEKGPQMKELEQKALRIAKEIEGEDTHDLHLAEERGRYHDDFDSDEETRFSSVYRGKGVDDSGYDEDEEPRLDSYNSETFGSITGSVIKNPGEISGGKANNGAQTWSNFSKMDHSQSSLSNTGVDLGRSGADDHAKQLASELSTQNYSFQDGECRIQNCVSDPNETSGNATEENQQAEDVRLSKSEGSYLQPPHNLKNVVSVSDKGESLPNTTSFTPSPHIISKGLEKTGLCGEFTTGTSASGRSSEQTKAANSRGRVGSASSSGSDNVGGVAASSGSGLSPSSSVGSLSSERSTLNPHAKEFKLNPNAKSFIPSQNPVRPRSPVSDGSFYFPANVSTVPNMPAMPMGIGVGNTFAGPPQPMIYNPQVAQMPSQAYFHPNGPQYGQLLGHPRQVLYMPSYLPETPYKGRDY